MLHVSTGGRVQLRLDLDPASDPISGALHGAAGHAVEFAGWMGFSAAIAQALRDLRGNPAPVDRPLAQPTEPSSSPVVDRSAEVSSSRE